MKPVVEVSHLGKTFKLKHRDVNALSGISFDIQWGEYLSIMGPSGSGKSTLFNMIGALDRPSSGFVRVGGIDLANLDQRKLAYFRGRYIGYIFQSYNLIAAYSARLNVALPLIFNGSEKEEAYERADKILSEVGLGHRLDNRPDQLSGGQQQRVAIARALVNEPLIILADEPTANLDFKTGEAMIELLSSLCKKRNTTIISATHDHKMLACSDRILWIRDGKVDRIASAEEAAVQIGSIE